MKMQVMMKINLLANHPKKHEILNLCHSTYGANLSMQNKLVYGGHKHSHKIGLNIALEFWIWVGLILQLYYIIFS